MTGQFDQATYAAVEDLQTERQLFVDGIVGRETAISVGVWPDEAALVVHTPPPAPGAEDSMGFPLSSVSSVGADAPPVPADSGSGRRIVYERAGQRVWAIDSDNQVIRSWLVSGSKYGNEQPGFHEVYSRSEQSTAWNGKAILPLMVRYQKTDIGAIGFHGIPHARRGRQRLPDRGRAGHPAVRRLPAPGQPRRRLHVELRPGRHARSSSSDGWADRAEFTFSERSGHIVPPASAGMELATPFVVVAAAHPSLDDAVRRFCDTLRAETQLRRGAARPRQRPTGRARRAARGLRRRNHARRHARR